ncbi:hypothetical protein ACLI07_02390 [Providencia huaxiensis]|uniref:hypothetical protein n=1 Tax=Providencia TaxID=586 RepID=UPI00234B7BDB|nr:hypothetical protein [Providencia sp. PROV076]
MKSKIENIKKQLGIRLNNIELMVSRVESNIGELEKVSNSVNKIIKTNEQSLKGNLLDNISHVYAKSKKMLSVYKLDKNRLFESFENNYNVLLTNLKNNSIHMRMLEGNNKKELEESLKDYKSIKDSPKPSYNRPAMETKIRLGTKAIHFLGGNNEYINKYSYIVHANLKKLDEAIRDFDSYSAEVYIGLVNERLEYIKNTETIDSIDDNINVSSAQSDTESILGEQTSAFAHSDSLGVSQGGTVFELGPRNLVPNMNWRQKGPALI